MKTKVFVYPLFLSFSPSLPLDLLKLPISLPFVRWRKLKWNRRRRRNTARQARTARKVNVLWSLWIDLRSFRAFLRGFYRLRSFLLHEFRHSSSLSSSSGSAGEGSGSAKDQRSTFSPSGLPEEGCEYGLGSRWAAEGRWLRGIPLDKESFQHFKDAVSPLKAPPPPPGAAPPQQESSGANSSDNSRGRHSSNRSEKIAKPPGSIIQNTVTGTVGEWITVVWLVIQTIRPS